MGWHAAAEWYHTQVARGVGVGIDDRVFARCSVGAEWATYRLRGLRRRGLAGLVCRRGVGLVRDGDLDDGRGGGLVVGGGDGHAHGFVCGFVWVVRGAVGRWLDYTGP